MAYPQNLGLAAAVDRLRQRNQMNAMRPVSPYGASPGENPSPAGLYAAGLQHAQNYQYGDGSYQGGLMTNYGAVGGMRNIHRTYMPSRRVACSFGLVAHAPYVPDNPY